MYIVCTCIYYLRTYMYLYLCTCMYTVCIYLHVCTCMYMYAVLHTENEAWTI